MPYFNNKNIRLYYEVQGRDDPLVLIADIGRDITQWDNIRNELARRFQVIMLENRGVGNSESIEGDLALNDLAEDVVALLDHLNISKADILGHSFGGAVAQYLASEFPERINRVIISHSFIQFRPSSTMVCLHDYWIQKHGLDKELCATAVIPYIYSDKFLAEAENLSSLVANYHLKNEEQLESYLQQIELIKSINTSKLLRFIRNETFLIAGREDKFTPYQDSMSLSKGIANSQFVIMAGGHLPMIEQPQEYAEIVLVYLRNQMVRVNEFHKGEFLKPIKLNKGDEVIIGNEDNVYSGWVFCTSILNNVSGWVPKQLISNDSMDGGKLLEDYSAIELNVDINQMVIVKQQVSDWAWCFNGESYGWIPLSKLGI